MGVRVEYEVRKLPDTYVTTRTEYAFEQDGNMKDRHGNPRMKMIPKEVEERGGYLIAVRGGPGHSIRVQNLEQAHALGITLSPRLVNTETGEVCDERGIPMSVSSIVDQAGGGSDIVETDVDVIRNDAQLDLDLNDPGEAAVGDAINAVE